MYQYCISTLYNINFFISAAEKGMQIAEHGGKKHQFMHTLD